MDEEIRPERWHSHAASISIGIGIGVGRSLTENPEAAIQTAVAAASDELSEPASLCPAFPDWSSKSFDLIMKTLSRAPGHDCPVFGGVAGSLYDDKQAPLQFYRNEVLVDAMPIIRFAGPLEYSFSIANSWIPVGKQANITSAHGRRVNLIDDFKAAGL